VDAVSKKGSVAKQVTQLKEGGFPHPKKLNTTTIVAVIDETKIPVPLFISGTQRSIGNTSPRGRQPPKSDKKPCSDDCNQGNTPTDKLTAPS
jgi:hypothetical protein